MLLLQKMGGYVFNQCCYFKKWVAMYLLGLLKKLEEYKATKKSSEALNLWDIV
jgi:hypothetical protein